jgi:hypothetical protein
VNRREYNRTDPSLECLWEKFYKNVPLVAASLSVYSNCRIVEHIFTNFSSESGYQNLYIHCMFGGIEETTKR